MLSSKLLKIMLPLAGKIIGGASRLLRDFLLQSVVDTLDSRTGQSPKCPPPPAANNGSTCQKT